MVKDFLKPLQAGLVKGITRLKEIKEAGVTWITNAFDTTNLHRKTRIMIHDLLASLAAFPCGLWILRGGLDGYTFGFLFKHMAVYTLSHAAIFFAMQQYRGLWRYASSTEATFLLLNVLCGTALYLPLMALMNRGGELPTLTPFLSGFILLTVLMGSRFGFRAFHGRLQARQAEKISSTPQSRLLIIGINPRIDAFTRRLMAHQRSAHEIIGIVLEDDTPHGKRKDLNGIPILGTMKDLPTLIAAMNEDECHPHHVILSDIPAFGSDKLTTLLDLAGDYKFDLCHLSDPQSQAHDPTLRPVTIQDLIREKGLGLDDQDLKSYFQNKSVLITGAGGTIGRALALNLAPFNPRLILLDRAENALYETFRDIQTTFPNLSLETVLADVCATSEIKQTMADHKPQIIFHGAMMKHAHLAERHPCQAVLTNVMGTQNIAEGAMKHGATIMVLLSSDQAYLPGSVMGATKRLAESLCQNYDRSPRNKGTRFVPLRFCNVMESEGSVVPLFHRQISQGGPLTLTHPKASKRFLTLDDALSLILEATLAASFAPKTLGKILAVTAQKPIAIETIAKTMIQLQGMTPGEEITLKYTGLRLGEKIQEIPKNQGQPFDEAPSERLNLLAIPPLKNLEDRDFMHTLEKAAYQADTKVCRQILDGLDHPVHLYGKS